VQRIFAVQRYIANVQQSVQIIIAETVIAVVVVITIVVTVLFASIRVIVFFVCLTAPLRGVKRNRESSTPLQHRQPRVLPFSVVHTFKAAHKKKKNRAKR
jgi:hypothetical protein